SRRGPEGHFDRAVRRRSPPDVRGRGPARARHAAGAGLVLGAGPGRRHDALSDLAARGRGTLPRQGPGRAFRIPEAGPGSTGALRVVAESVPPDPAFKRTRRYVTPSRLRGWRRAGVLDFVCPMATVIASSSPPA